VITKVHVVTCHLKTKCYPDSYICINIFTSGTFCLGIPCKVIFFNSKELIYVLWW